MDIAAVASARVIHDRPAVQPNTAHPNAATQKRLERSCAIKKWEVPMTRIARCCCGSLRVEATGEPWIIHLSLHGVSTAYRLDLQRQRPFSQAAGAYQRPSKVYVRAGDSGRKVEFHFCPDCGTSVFWYAEARPDHIGIASGTFADRRCPGRQYPFGRRRGIRGYLGSSGRSVYRPRIDAGNKRVSRPASVPGS